MAELRVRRSDLVPGARTLEASQITISHLDRPTVARDIADITFVDDDDSEHVIKSRDGLHSPVQHPDYLSRKEELTSEGDDSREGEEGAELQHRHTRGPGTAADANEDGESRSDGIVGGQGTSAELGQKTDAEQSKSEDNDMDAEQSKEDNTSDEQSGDQTSEQSSDEQSSDEQSGGEGGGEPTDA